MTWLFLFALTTNLAMPSTVLDALRLRNFITFFLIRTPDLVLNIEVAVNGNDVKTVTRQTSL